MEKLYNSETGCCRRFNPKPWQNKKISFKGKLFVKDRVISLFHIPLNFGRVMTRNMEKIENANALARVPLCISDENSLFGSDVYIAVSKKVPDSEIVKFPGTFFSRVYEGQFRNMGKWIKDMASYLKKTHQKASKLYFFYTTCPKCAKVYGKNYVVVLGKVK